MPRAHRVQFEGAIYHVTARGVDRRAIFADDRDREHFLKRLQYAVETHQVRLYLFCLMPNHVHLLLETPLGNLSRLMQAVLTSHATYFNLRHQRVGHLFQGRFHARLVGGNEYLLRLTRYVHLNPAFTDAAKALSLKQRVALLHRHRWSSYAGYVDRSKRIAFVRYDPILAFIAAGRRRPEEAYRAYVEEGLAQTDQEFHDLVRSSSKAIGPEPLALRAVSETEEFGRSSSLLAPDFVLSVVAKAFGQTMEQLQRRQRDSTARGVAAMMLCKWAGQPQRKAAASLGLRSSAAVSVQLRNIREELAADRKLQQLVSTIEKTLQASS